MPVLAPSLCLLQMNTKKTARCEDQEASYYGSYQGDRFGGGIGNRVGIDESRAQHLKGTGVTRVTLISESHERLREWATAENWREATRIHKAAYFTRTENLAQEAMQQRIRQHYVSNHSPQHVGRHPIQAALFRLDSEAEFQKSCDSTVVSAIPSVVFGKFDEKRERCIVDFANKRLGGGWLGYGMVQEEIMFTERPDYGALCARSLLEMEDPVRSPLASPLSMYQNEAWVLRGAPRFAHVPWYGRTPPDGAEKVKLLNPKDDQYTCPTVIAIDAIKADFPVYQRRHLEMMLIKAYVGYVAASRDPDCGCNKTIATGSWGCGAFYNNEKVMFVVQSLAASMAGVKLDYHVLGDGHRLAAAFDLLEDVVVKKRTVSETIDNLAHICATDAAWQSKFKPRSKQ